LEEEWCEKNYGEEQQTQTGAVKKGVPFQKAFVPVGVFHEAAEFFRPIAGD